MRPTLMSLRINKSGCGWLAGVIAAVPAMMACNHASQDIYRTKGESMDG